MELIDKTVAADFRIHPFGGILGCAKAETVKTEGKFIISGAFIFSAGIKFAEKKFPVIALFVIVPINRASAAEVFDLGGTVVIACYDYFFAVTRSCFIYGVGYNFESGVFTAFDSVGTENYRRALSYPFGAV